MSAYIRLTDKAYPRHEGDIRNEHPEITEDQTGDTFPCPDDYALVQWVYPPSTNPPLEYAYEGPPEQVDGQWRMTWIIGTRTQEEWDAMLAEVERIKNPQPPGIDPKRLEQPGSAPDVEG
jgi:hypothetical protein